MTKKLSLWNKMQVAFQSISKRTGPSTAQNSITVVSGLPRSGTSMMMKMLEAGGIPPLTDQLRLADEDNPKGYHEFERVKKLDKGDVAWVSEAQGKAVKVISLLLKHLPSQYDYRIIFMQRRLEETLASQAEMLKRQNKTSDTGNDEILRASLQKHLAQVKPWIEQQPHFTVLYVSYNDVIQNPQAQAQRINDFLDNRLDIEQMMTVVDTTLYRQRHA